MKRSLRIVAAVVLAAAALVAVLFASDLLLARGKLQSGDTSFASGSTNGNLWTPFQALPFGGAKALLGLDDDVTYRQAVRAFVLGRPRDTPYSDTDLLGKRGQAKEALQGIVDGGGDPGRRSDAANLIGVLGFADASLDPDGSYNYLSEAITKFRQSIAFDPDNADAKYNLELALSRIKDLKPPQDQQKSSDTRGGSGSGAGTGEPGTGY